IRTLLPGDAAELPFPFVESAATMPALRDSLARMAALDPVAALYCHAPITSGPALLRANIAYFDTVERRCRAALARGAPARPAAARPARPRRRSPRRSSGLPRRRRSPPAPTRRSWPASTGRGTRARSGRCWSTWQDRLSFAFQPGLVYPEGRIDRLFTRYIVA